MCGDRHMRYGSSATTGTPRSVRSSNSRCDAVVRTPSWPEYAYTSTARCGFRL